MENEPTSNRREFYRLRYPEQVRPLLKYKRLELPVAELSEGGARLAIDDTVLSDGEPIAGDIRFADGAVFGIVGTVLRREPDETILKLTLSVPLRRMLSEQKWVMRDFVDLLRNDEDE